MPSAHAIALTQSSSQVGLRTTFNFIQLPANAFNYCQNYAYIRTMQVSRGRGEGYAQRAHSVPTIHREKRALGQRMEAVSKQRRNAYPERAARARFEVNGRLASAVSSRRLIVSKRAIRGTKRNDVPKARSPRSHTTPSALSNGAIRAHKQRCPLFTPPPLCSHMCLVLTSRALRSGTPRALARIGSALDCLPTSVNLFRRQPLPPTAAPLGLLGLGLRVTPNS